MTGRPSQPAWGQALGDADLRHLIEVFRASGRQRVRLRMGDTELTLEVPGAAPAPPPADPRDARSPVASPGVGTFRAAQDWTPGTRVAAGTLLGHVRSLGRNREVRAETAGVIAAQRVSDGGFVAYGDPLFDLDVPEGPA